MQQFRGTECNIAPSILNTIQNPKIEENEMKIISDINFKDRINTGLIHQ